MVFLPIIIFSGGVYMIVKEMLSLDKESIFELGEGIYTVVYLDSDSLGDRHNMAYISVVDGKIESNYFDDLKRHGVYGESCYYFDSIDDVMAAWSKKGVIVHEVYMVKGQGFRDFISIIDFIVAGFSEFADLC
jgi:hypothetical protein